MIQNNTKLLLLIGLSSMLTGCFLTLDVGEGGMVESNAGDCEQFSTCSYEVEDATFDETFTAIPKGGYVFSHWRGGEGYLCPGSENPNCVASNTEFADNEGAAGFIANDIEFKIEPMFRPMTVPSLVMVDANDKVIGHIIQNDASFVHTGQRFIVAMRFPESDRAYMVTLYGNHTGQNGKVEGSDIVYFQGSNCTGQAYMDVWDGDPIGQDRNFMDSVGDGRDANYIPDPNAVLVPGEYAPTGSAWSPQNDRCERTSQTQNVVPAIEVDMDFDYPLRAVFR